MECFIRVKNILNEGNLSLLVLPSSTSWEHFLDVLVKKCSLPEPSDTLPFDIEYKDEENDPILVTSKLEYATMLNYFMSVRTKDDVKQNRIPLKLSIIDNKKRRNRISRKKRKQRLQKQNKDKKLKAESHEDLIEHLQYFVPDLFNSSTENVQPLILYIDANNLFYSTPELRKMRQKKQWEPLQRKLLHFIELFSTSYSRPIEEIQVVFDHLHSTINQQTMTITAALRDFNVSSDDWIVSQLSNRYSKDFKKMIVVITSDVEFRYRLQSISDRIALIQSETFFQVLCRIKNVTTLEELDSIR